MIGPLRALLHGVFVKDALLKLVSLALALALFVFVRVDRDGVTGVPLRVVYETPKDRVLISEPVTELRVSVRGSRTQLAILDDRPLEPLHVELARAKDGELVFDTRRITLPPGLRVSSVTPPSVRLRFEPRVERTVPVQPVIEGELPQGYRVLRSVPTPRTVKVSGARSVVDGIARALTVPLRVADAKETFKSEVVLAPPPPHAEWRDPGPVAVEVEIAAALAEKVLRAVPVRVVGAERLSAEHEPRSADVVLRGPADALARVAAGAPALLVDMQAEDGKPPGTWHKRIGVSGLPAGVAAEVRPESVTLMTRRRHD